MSGDFRDQRPAPAPQNVDWPALVGIAERLRRPVGRVDDHGELHIIRTLAQLRAEWE